MARFVEHAPGRALVGRVALGAAGLTARIAQLDLATMIWSHHWPDQHERCEMIGGRAVCRRCLVLYPIAFTVMALSLAGVHWPSGLDAAALFLLPLPVVVEFIGEQVGALVHRPRRQIVTTALAAAALGRSLGRYLGHRGDGLFWAMVVVYGGLCALSAVGRHVRDSRLARRAADVDLRSDPLSVGFASRDDFVAYLDSHDDAMPGRMSRQPSGSSPVSSSVTN